MENQGNYYYTSNLNESPNNNNDLPNNNNDLPNNNNDSSTLNNQTDQSESATDYQKDYHYDVSPTQPTMVSNLPDRNVVYNQQLQRPLIEANLPVPQGYQYVQNSRRPESH